MLFAIIIRFHRYHSPVSFSKYVVQVYEEVLYYFHQYAFKIIGLYFKGAKMRALQGQWVYHFSLSVGNFYRNFLPFVFRRRDPFLFFEKPAEALDAVKTNFICNFLNRLVRMP